MIGNKVKKKSIIAVIVAAVILLSVAGALWFVASNENTGSQTNIGEEPQEEQHYILSANLPDDASDELKSNHEYDKALEYISQDNIQKAKDHLQKALDFNQKNTKVVIKLAEIHEEQGDSEEASRFYSQALTLMEDELKSAENTTLYDHFLLGRIAQNAQKTEKAREYYQKVVNAGQDQKLDEEGQAYVDEAQRRIEDLQ